MPTNNFCVAAAAPDKPRFGLAAMLAAAGLLGACAAPSQQAAQVAPAASPTPEAQSLDGAVTSMVTALVSRAQLNPAEARVLVIDPPVDQATVRQDAMTRDVERRISKVVAQRFPNMHTSPMGEDARDRQPIMLLSCMTPVAAAGAMPTYTGGPPKVYRIWASLSDTRTGKVVSTDTAWVRAEDVDTTPTRFFQDSPIWAMDNGMKAYLKVCGGKTGDTIDPAYLNGMSASIAADEGMKAYEAGRYPESLAAYTRAGLLPSGDQMRVWNGLYLTNLALGRSKEAEQAFGHMVDTGLAQGKVAVKFVFRPATAQFWPDREVSGQYPVWLRQIALHSAARRSCLLLTGHTSVTGPATVNDTLSEQRAEFVRERLVQRAPVLQARTEARGVGSREPVVGTGSDNATDLLDRRVELEPRPCSTLQASRAPDRT